METQQALSQLRACIQKNYGIDDVAVYLTYMASPHRKNMIVCIERLKTTAAALESYSLDIDIDKAIDLLCKARIVAREAEYVTDHSTFKALGVAAIEDVEPDLAQHNPWYTLVNIAHDNIAQKLECMFGIKGGVDALMTYRDAYNYSGYTRQHRSCATMRAALSHVNLDDVSLEDADAIMDLAHESTAMRCNKLNLMHDERFTKLMIQGDPSEAFERLRVVFERLEGA